MAEKPLIALLHGLWHTSASWAAIAKQLQTQGFATYTPDWLNPHWLDGKLFTFEQIATPIIKHISNHLSVQSSTTIHFVGHSFGSALVHYLLHHTPSDIRHSLASATHISGIIPNAGSSFLDTIPTHFAGNIKRFCKNGMSHLPYLIWREQFANNNPKARQLYKSAIVPTSEHALSMTLSSVTAVQHSIPVHYIQLDDDATLPKDDWQIMAQNAGAQTIQTCAGAHEALLTEPINITRAIHNSVSRQCGC